MGDTEMTKTVKVTNLDNNKYVLIDSDLNTLVNMANSKLEKGLETMVLENDDELFGDIYPTPSNFAISFNLNNIKIEEISVEDSNINQHKNHKAKLGEDYFEFYDNELDMLKLNKLAIILLQNYELAETTTITTRDRIDNINRFVAYNQEKGEYTIPTVGGCINFKNDQELPLPYRIVIEPVTNRFKTILKKQNNQSICQLINYKWISIDK